ncbi:MAG: hypothetical protein NT121_06740 [Chloroflexi bacterium]|nr:hypothetical protein [Chloroflexota bacterium]
MIDFNKYSQATDLKQELASTQVSDIATAEYTYFTAHQIRTWYTWVDPQEELSYVIDCPRFMNAEESADV